MIRVLTITARGGEADLGAEIKVTIRIKGKAIGGRGPALESALAWVADRTMDAIAYAPNVRIPTSRQRVRRG